MQVLCKVLLVVYLLEYNASPCNSSLILATCNHLSRRSRSPWSPLLSTVHTIDRPQRLLWKPIFPRPHPEVIFSNHFRPPRGAQNLRFFLLHLKTTPSLVAH
uniref:(northern house mosquito) hypothetical protein n=1 Tax=Culex pipiens TaxID=7175 RepID=A0A8D8CH84_CULPI